MALEFRDIGGDLCCGGVFLKVVDREAVDQGGDSVRETEGLFELGLKVRPSTKAGESGSKDSLSESGCPGEGRAFGHVE